MIWKTKDGAEIAVKDMEDLHIINVIKFLNKQHEIKKIEYSKTVDQMCHEDKYGYHHEPEKPVKPKIYYALVKEAKRRGIC